jgi:hypothetical protein
VRASREYSEYYRRYSRFLSIVSKSFFTSRLSEIITNSLISKTIARA